MKTATTSLPTTTAPFLPAFSSIDGFCELASISRSALYLALGRKDILAIKAGKRTLIVTAPALAWLRSLPLATFRSPKS